MPSTAPRGCGHDLIDLIALRADRHAGGVADRDPDPAAQGLHRMAGQPGLGQLLPGRVVRKPVRFGGRRMLRIDRHLRGMPPAVAVRGQHRGRLRGGLLQASGLVLATAERRELRHTATIATGTNVHTGGPAGSGVSSIGRVQHPVSTSAPSRSVIPLLMYSGVSGWPLHNVGSAGQVGFRSRFVDVPWSP